MAESNQSSGEFFDGSAQPVGRDGMPVPSGRRAGFVRIEPDGTAHVWRMWEACTLIDAAREADDRLREFPPLAGRRWAHVIEVDPDADFGRLPADAREKAGCRNGTFFLEETGGTWFVRAYSLKMIPLAAAMDGMRRNVRNPARAHVFGVGRGGIHWDAAEKLEKADFGKVRACATAGERVSAGGIILP